MQLLKITLDKERRIKKVETDQFMVRLNGLPNQHYRDVLAPLGIELVFVEDTTTMAAVAENEGKN